MISKNAEKKLRQIVGPDRYVTSREDLLSASYDAFVIEGMPDAVLFPKTTDEVSQIMKIAWAESIPVTARGPARTFAELRFRLPADWCFLSQRCYRI